MPPGAATARRLPQTMQPPRPSSPSESRTSPSPKSTPPTTPISPKSTTSRDSPPSSSSSTASPRTTAAQEPRRPSLRGSTRSWARGAQRHRRRRGREDTLMGEDKAVLDFLDSLSMVSSEHLPLPFLYRQTSFHWSSPLHRKLPLPFLIIQSRNRFYYLLLQTSLQNFCPSLRKQQNHSRESFICLCGERQ